MRAGRVGRLSGSAHERRRALVARRALRAMRIALEFRDDDKRAWGSSRAVLAHPQGIPRHDGGRGAPAGADRGRAAAALVPRRRRPPASTPTTASVPVLRARRRRLSRRAVAQRGVRLRPPARDLRRIRVRRDQHRRRRRQRPPPTCSSSTARAVRRSSAAVAAGRARLVSRGLDGDRRTAVEPGRPRRRPDPPRALLMFVSEASNLVRGDRNGQADAFAYDLRSGRTRDGLGRPRPVSEMAVDGSVHAVAYCPTRPGEAGLPPDARRARHAVPVRLLGRRRGNGDSTGIAFSKLGGAAGAAPLRAKAGQSRRLRSTATNLARATATATRTSTSPRSRARETACAGTRRWSPPRATAAPATARRASPRSGTTAPSSPSAPRPQTCCRTTATACRHRARQRPRARAQRGSPARRR